MKNTNKKAQVKKDARNFGCKTDWYKKENLIAVEMTNPTYIVGGKVWPAAYFVETVETVHDEMFGREEIRRAVAGPFSCETIAQEWADSYNSCPF